MKKLFTFLMLAFAMLIMTPANAQFYDPQRFVPAKAIITNADDDLEFSRNVAVYCEVDTAYNCVDFQLKTREDVTNVIHFTVEYMTCTDTGNGFVLYLDKNSILVMEDSGIGKACKLTIRDIDGVFTKLVFLFYLID